MNERSKRHFVAIRAAGPAWNHALSMEQQPEWDEHAALMDAMVEEKFIVLGGPLEGPRHGALLVFRAHDEQEILARLADDPWTRNGLLVMDMVRPWTIRLGSIA
ncbi:MAG TPA: YciI family protein [Candidatus Eisenbacteria bacterium]|nr:YciI family protein [Candidatus Eisenbacteria bacterium]